MGNDEETPIPSWLDPKFKTQFDSVTITRATPELDATIARLEKLAVSGEPRGAFEDDLIDLVIETAKACRRHIQQVR